MNHLEEKQIEKIVLANLKGEQPHEGFTHVQNCSACHSIYIELCEYYKLVEQQLLGPDYFKVDMLARALSQKSKVINLKPFTPEIDHNIVGSNFYLLSADTELAEVNLKPKTYTFASIADNLLVRVNVDFAKNVTNVFLLSEQNFSTSYCLIGFTDTEKFFRKFTNASGEIEFSNDEHLDWSNASVLIFKPDVTFKIEAENIVPQSINVEGFTVIFGEDKGGVTECIIEDKKHFRYAILVYGNDARLVNISSNKFIIKNLYQVNEVKLYV